ncbi:MAG: hypothetical protein LBD22_06425 [Spirochaetaceae bacterium]|jgi:hypothetical protein|nr:hypothetical protein [Spirochaetaceae bacterium]
MRKLLFIVLIGALSVALISADEYWLPTPSGGYMGPYYSRPVEPQQIVPPSQVYLIPQYPVDPYYTRPISPPPLRVQPRYTAPGFPGSLAARYLMTVREYYAVGNVHLPSPDYVDSAQCSIFRDGSLVVTLFYTNDTYVEYRISNPVLQIRQSHAYYKTSYSSVVKSGYGPVFDPISCDVYSSRGEIHQIVLHGMSRSSITINLRRF